MLKTTFVNRKDLVSAVAEFVKEEPVYMYAPTFAYKVGDYTINKDGSITSNSEMDKLNMFLIEKGFIQQEIEKLNIEDEPIQKNYIKFSIPIGETDKQGIINFINMLYSKQYLINKALQMDLLSIKDDFLKKIQYKEIEKLINAENLGFAIEEDNIVFFYPNIENGEKLKAYMTLMCMAFAKAKESKRIQAKIVNPENEKYYMRVWLIRLGLGGKGGAETRKILLKNLRGHSAFRTEEELQKAKEKYKQRKAEK